MLTQGWWTPALIIAAAVVPVALTTAVRIAADPLLEDSAVAVFYILGIFGAATIGGWWSGLLATVLSTLVADYFFIGQPDNFTVFTAPDMVHLGVLVGSGLLVTWTVELLHQSRQRLHLAERNSAWHAAIVRSSAEAIIGLDANGRVASWNRGASDLLGYPAEEMIGRDLSITLPDAGTDEIDELRQRAAEGGGVRGLESKRRRRDGSIVPVAVTVSEVRDGHGHVVGIAHVMRDISAQVRLEEQRAILARELDHRLKNNSAMIQAIANQTARGAESIDDFLQLFHGRILALARANAILFHHDWQSADLNEIVQGALRPFMDDERPCFSITGDPIVIDSRQALFMTMLIHELATNATKYGSLVNADNGRVELKWRTEADVTPEVVVCWIERGGPPVEAPRRNGFGSHLLLRAVELELGGSMRREFDPAGFRCEIRFPQTGVA